MSLMSATEIEGDRFDNIHVGSARDDGAPNVEVTCR